jgi:hypothetical protein
MANRTPATCDRWREAALARIGALQPVLVVITNYHWHSLLDPGGSGAHQSAPLRPDLWEQGLRRTLDRLPASSAILLLEDSPTARTDIPSCLVEHLDAVDRCAFAREAGIAPPLTLVERAISRSDPRVSYLDLTSHVCDGSVCPAARGRLALYADDNHFSVGFAASLSPWLAPAVDSSVAAARRRARGSPSARER